MGNICDTIGLTRKEPTKIDNNRIAATKTQDERVRTDSNDEVTIKSPVVAASAAALAISAEAVRVAELKAAYIRKQNEEAAAEAAAKAQMVGPRIRLLPHQHTLFCERKVKMSRFIPVEYFLFLLFYGFCSNGSVRRLGSFKN